MLNEILEAGKKERQPQEQAIPFAQGQAMPAIQEQVASPLTTPEPYKEPSLAQIARASKMADRFIEREQAALQSQKEEAEQVLIDLTDQFGYDHGVQEIIIEG